MFSIYCSTIRRPPVSTLVPRTPLFRCKHSGVYSATIPSVDSALSSWDGSGIDAGYGSQGALTSTPGTRYVVYRGLLSSSSVLIWMNLKFLFLVCTGTYLHRAADLTLHPNEWRRTRHRTHPTPTYTDLGHHATLYDGRFSEDDWDKSAG